MIRATDPAVVEERRPSTTSPEACGPLHPALREVHLISMNPRSSLSSSGMGNAFDTPAMAAGYARSRPAVHSLIVERARKHVRLPLPVEQALDVGCGAGLSTRALLSLARRCLGIDPSAAMVQCATALVPAAAFMVSSAEALPVPSHSMNLITAAGSLDYVDLSRFFPEAGRVLVPAGVLLVYDFSQGRSFRGSPRLDTWFSEFLCRYPMPTDACHAVSPESLCACAPGLRLDAHEDFEVSLDLTPEFYLDYMMTETNVAHAIQRGVQEPCIRSWCAETLAPVFQGRPREVLFRGYLACLVNETP